jgi:hypothetical protein
MAAIARFAPDTPLEDMQAALRDVGILMHISLPIPLCSALLTLSCLRTARPISSRFPASCKSGKAVNCNRSTAMSASMNRL